MSEKTCICRSDSPTPEVDCPRHGIDELLSNAPPSEEYIEEQIGSVDAEPERLSPFQQATPETLFNELHRVELEIESEGRLIKRLGDEVATKKATYEELKNKMLLDMFKEEFEGQVAKRTDARRTALYRHTYAEQRLAWQLAEKQLEAANAYLKALMANQISLECRVKLVDHDGYFAGKTWTSQNLGRQ